MPLKFAHDTGAPVSGSGITFAAPLTKPHDKGTPVAGNIPTPGEPNQFFRK
jgi:non-reducing end alpha-L-arabinofuranosidase